MRKTEIVELNSQAARLNNRRSVEATLRSILELTSQSNRIFHGKCGKFESGNDEYSIDQFAFIGPRGGQGYTRVAIFAGIHGDEPSGTLASLRFLELLNTKPDLARGYEIFVVPICNPTGFEDGTRWARSGKDLNRLFWQNVKNPEIEILERTIRSGRFDGIISLHSDDTSHGLYGFASGVTLNEYLLQPALRAASSVLPVNQGGVIDNFPANNGIIKEGYRGILEAPIEQRPRPFEIIFETPQNFDLELQIQAHVLALESIITEHRSFISHAMDL